MLFVLLSNTCLTHIRNSVGTCCIRRMAQQSPDLLGCGRLGRLEWQDCSSLELPRLRDHWFRLPAVAGAANLRRFPPALRPPCGDPLGLPR